MDEKKLNLWQTSEHNITAWILAIVGGYLDAYSYLCRGGVFANAQTGNIVLMGVSLAEGRFKMALHFLYPILAFVLGVFICEIIKNRRCDDNLFHWRQIIIMIEIVVIVIAGFIPIGEGDSLVNLIISFVCALQVEAFRKVKGNAFASTMCTGNLRSGTERIFKYMNSKDKKQLKDSLQYYSVIMFFIIGAAVGRAMTSWLGASAVTCSAVGLVVVFILMVKEYVEY